MNLLQVYTIYNSRNYKSGFDSSRSALVNLSTTVEIINQVLTDAIAEGFVESTTVEIINQVLTSFVKSSAYIYNSRNYKSGFDSLGAFAEL